MTARPTGPIRPNPELNRRLIAERLGWPDGANERCHELALAHPDWRVFWVSGRTPQAPKPGYQAILNCHGWRGELFAPTADELDRQLAAADALLPPWPRR